MGGCAHCFIILSDNGTVDIHNHMGVMSAPTLWGAYYLLSSCFRLFTTRSTGAIDLTTGQTPVASHMRSIDGFNTHDESFRLVLAGGVTTAQILPGSQNNIGELVRGSRCRVNAQISSGGQAFIIKTRRTRERSPSSMALEPHHSYNGSKIEPGTSPHWRHMK